MVRSLRSGAIAVFAGVWLAGCAENAPTLLTNASDRGRLLLAGPLARVNADDVAAHRLAYTPLLYDFALQAGQLPVPIGTPPDVAAQQRGLASVQNWTAVVRVAQGYVDTQCFAFLAALDQLEEARRASLANLNALQSATVGILGLARAAQTAIGYVGIGFGLTASLFDNTTGMVLYELPAASVRGIVSTQRDRLRLNEDAVLARISNQGLAAARIAEYVQYCAPVTIRANIARVLGAARVTSDGDIVIEPTRPAITPALAPVISGIRPGTPLAPVAPANRGVIPQPLGPQNAPRLAAILRTIRAAQTDQATLERVAAALEVPMTEDTAALRRQLVVTANNRVSTAPEAQRGQLLDGLETLLRLATPPG